MEIENCTVDCDQPFVSVIMPIRNEAGFVHRSLGAVLAQDYPADRLEVLVVDGMSDDGTREMVRRMAERGGWRGEDGGGKKGPVVRLLDNPGRIVPTAMNVGIGEACGDIIIRVDGHTEIASDYVRWCVYELDHTEADNVGGRMAPVGDGAFGRAVALATSSPFGVGGGRFHYSDRREWVDTVYMGAWPREVFERVGGFDEQFVRNQDDEFNYRLLSSGGKILLSPRIRSRYHNRSTPGSLWRQYRQYGYWKVRVMQKHPSQMRARQFVPPTFAAVLVGSVVLALFAGLGRLLLAGVAGTYLTANLVASLWTARRDWRTLPLLPLAFSILHLAYGFGFLWGLWKWRKECWGEKASEPVCLQRGAQQ